MTDPATPATDPTSASVPPTIVGYRLLSPIGEGGMSAVYLAEQISLGRKVAIKVMGPHVAASAEACDRFVREARAAAAVNHSNVVSIIDVGQAAGQLYMVLELVTEGDAAQLAEQHGGILPEKRALQIMVDCAKGLEALHEANLVHRDLKPSNIFLARDGTAKIGDLGLARSAAGTDRMTITGHLIGTPAFMSPEQAGGEKLDIRSDIYSLGATLFALVTGRQPFVANTPIAVAAKAMVEPTPDPLSINPRLSPPLVAVILRCMAKDPASRFQTPTDLRQEFEHLLATSNAAAQDSSIKPISGIGNPTSAKSPARSRYTASHFIITGITLTILLSTWMFYPSQHSVSTSLFRGSSSDLPVKPSGISTTVEAPTKAINADVLEAPIPERPAWASAWGQDIFGTWCEIHVDQARQRLRWIPPGRCTIGSPTTEEGRLDVERLSDVTFSFGVWMADTECPQPLWDAVMEVNPSKEKSSRFPVTNIDIQSAITFTHRLSKVLGSARARIPSRAEWERACRAGGQTVYSTGDSPESLTGYANVNDADRQQKFNTRKIVGFSDGFVDLAPIASFKPNKWGLFDMHGNVYEYCIGSDWTPLPPTCTDPLIDDATISDLSFIRGGGYTAEDTGKYRCAAMPNVGRASTGFDIGFRFLIEHRR